MISRWMGGALAAGLALGAAACGSSVNVDGGGGAGGAGGTGTTTTTTGIGGTGGVIPPECAVQTSDPGPYPVVFQFENSGVGTTYLMADCRFQLAVRACEDGYADALSLHGDCSGPCDEPLGGCVACEACPWAAVAVTPGSQMSETWEGYRYTFGTDVNGCICHDQHVARAGRYQVTVPVWTSAPVEPLGPPSYQVTVDFELPAPNGVVVVPIGQSP